MLYRSTVSSGTPSLLDRVRETSFTDDACTVIAGNVRASLVVVGIGLVIVGGSGPDSIGIASIFGIVTLLAATVLAAPFAELLRTDEEIGSDDPRSEVHNVNLMSSSIDIVSPECHS